jgi:integrase
MNREQAYLRAVFNELIRLNHWKKENPLKKLRAFKVQERELSYLTPVQIVRLLAELDKAQNPHVALVAKVCLSTGSRWGEAEALRITQARNGIIQFVQTKSSKARAVPITKELEDALTKHHKTKAHRDDEDNSKSNDERIFASAYGAFRDALKRSELRLPAGQMTHVLRHTFSSHFMMNGGNILALQKVLGHHSLAMTMRYAHLSPEHLQETRQLNPLTALNLG